MWNQLKIEETFFYVECKIVKKFVKFILYDLKQSWCEYIELSDVLLRAKELNKRIRFDELTVQATLLAADAEDAQFEKDNEVAMTLKLKYRINALPFHFKWHLKEQKELEFREAFTIPLIMSLNGMSQQIEELRETIVKKDIELKQYKDEGAVLRRTTVATKVFDFLRFDEKYADVNKVTKGFKKIADNLMDQLQAEKMNAPDLPCQIKEPNPVEVAIDQTNKKSQIIQNEKTKLSPGSRKRKNLQLQHKRLGLKINARKQKLEYESSQSPIESSPDLDVISQELAAIQNSLRDLEKQRIADLNKRSESRIFS